MARHESDREDLFAEATALVRRVELLGVENSGDQQTVVAGYRRDGVLTVYLSPDEMYQFTPEGELRRALLGEDLFRTQGTTLAKLTRHRTASETELLRRDLTSDELDAFLDSVRQRLQSLLAATSDAKFRSVRQEPSEGDVVALLTLSLRQIVSAPLRLAPALPTKRR